MICQCRGCKNKATWREVDQYTQQKQTFTYFYYMCDEHKATFDHPTIGHIKKFQLLFA